MNMTPLSAMRHAADVSLKDVAVALGCTHQAVSSFENGRTELKPELVKKYARQIGLDEATVRRLQLRSKLQFHRREAARVEAELRATPAKARKLSAVS